MRSPYFLIDEQRLRSNLQLIHSVQEQAGVQVLLALKAFSFWPSFDVFRSFGFEGAASSYHEARLIHEELGKPAHTFSTVFYDDDFDAICDHSSHLIFNSVSMLEKYKGRATERGMSIGLRVNPEWSDVQTDLYNPASTDSRLGVTAQSLGDYWDDSIEGLHFHVLCESDSYSFEQAFRSFEEKFGHRISQVKWLNFGGGHLMTKAGYDTDHLVQLLKGILEKYNVKIYLEPGAAFVWQTGELITEVMDIVNNGSTKIACLDVSFTCHMPDTLEMPYKPTVIGEVAESEHEYILGGTSCLAGDFIRGFHFENPLQVGDRLVFEDMIQYTLVKTTFFNGVKHPSVYRTKTDGSTELLRSYTYQHFKDRC